MTKRFNEQDLNRVVRQPGYTVGHCAFAPVAPGLHHPIAQLDAGEKPLGAYEDQEAGSARLIVRITRHGIKLLDKDNLYGGAKPICDALRYERLIPEDDPESIHLVVRQRKVRRRDAGTLIEIIPIK